MKQRQSKGWTAATAVRLLSYQLARPPFSAFTSALVDARGVDFTLQLDKRSTTTTGIRKEKRKLIDEMLQRGERWRGKPSRV
jgi:hypothetical protein